MKLAKNTSDWQSELAGAISSSAKLLAYLNMDAEQLSVDDQPSFPTLVPHSFAQRMKKGDPNDPLLRQVFASTQERIDVPGFVNDPLGEADVSPVPGLLHKYQGRVLLTLAGGCAVNCRYCFRRAFPYQDHVLGRPGFQAILAYIAADPSIHEVIYSGGDPLLVNDKRLADFTQQLAAIPHVDTVRVHTRLPIVIPSRVNTGLLTALTQTRLKPVVVIHCNHPNEIDQSVAGAIKQFLDQGVMVLNQSVLLAGVNDCPTVLISLSKKLFSIGVLPYYLHQLDRVSGSASFAVSFDKGQQVMADLRAALPGYLVPRWVCEQAGAVSKLPIDQLKDELNQ